jgi:Uma2 family endonuclease
MATGWPEVLETPAALDGLYEVVDDLPVEKPSPGAFESELASILQDLLSPFARSHKLGRIVTEMLFDLRPAVDRQRRPDVAFVSAATWPLNRRAPKTAAWAVIPELAIEILSPTNSATEVLGKVQEYFTARVILVWVIYPDQEQVYAYESPTGITVLARGDTLDGGTVLPGFRLTIIDLFDALPDAA